MRGAIPDPDYGVAVNDLLDHGISFDDKTLVQALLNIYRKNFDISHEIEPNIFQATRDIFDNAAAEGIAQALSDGVEVDEAFIKALKSNNDVFSAFRTHKMQNDIAAQLLTSDGKLKPFSKFVRDVSPYIDHKNRLWLQTEYNTAVLRAHQAAAWQQFENEKDVYPNLRWIESTSPDPAADHKVFWNTVRPVNDPFWDVHRPGDRWNCKCSLEQSDDPVTPVPDSTSKDKPSPGLENNPAKDKQLFSDKHPYFPKDCSSCPLSSGKLSSLFHNLAGKKNCCSCVKISKSIKRSERNIAKRNELLSLNVETDTEKFRDLQYQMLETLRKNGELELNGKNLYTGHLFLGRKQMRNIKAHCYNGLELDAAKRLHVLLKKIKNGEYRYINTSRKNYKEKIRRGVRNYIAYDIEYDGTVFELKCEVMRDGHTVCEYPYSLKIKNEN